MLGRYGRYSTAIGGLAALVLLTGAAPAEPAGKPQSAPKAAPSQPDTKPDGRERLSAYERESLITDRAANRIAESANTISRDQRLYALWQLGLGGAGVVFTAIAAVAAIAAATYARQAAEAAGASAKADNAALKEIRKAARVARTDAAEQAARFQKEYTATHRPWIAIRDIKITGPLIVADGMAHAQFQLTLENTGTTPALNVVVQPRCTLKPSVTRAIDLLRKMAEEPRKAQFPFGQCIFPDELVEDYAVNLFNGDEMASVPVKDGTQKIMVFVYGYIAYRTVLDDDFRQTRFAFLIAPTTDGPTEMHVVDGKLECPPDELRVVRWPQGWEAD